MSTRLNILLAFICALIIANLYALQPLITTISKDVGISASSSGIILTCTQLGYCVGVFFIAPLGDMIENKKLIFFMLLALCACIIFASFESSAYLFLFATFAVGVTISTIQIIFPYGAKIASINNIGKTLGILAAGGVLGIVLSRPIASLLTEYASWRFSFRAFALTLLIFSFIFWLKFPINKPTTLLKYKDVIKSMFPLLKNTKVLQIKALFMALIFCIFTLFWAVVPIVLEKELNFSHQNIAYISFASIFTPIFAIVSGRLADRGIGMYVIFGSLTFITLAYMITPIFGISIALFILSIILLDLGFNTSSVITQQTILSLDAQTRSRLNSLLMCIGFIGASFGSFIGPWIYSHYGWTITSLVAVMIVFLALLTHLYYMYLKSKNEVV